MNIIRVVVVCSVCLLAGCQPAEQPVDLVKTQREALNKAKAVEGQLQLRADEGKKAADQADN